MRRAVVLVSWALLLAGCGAGDPEPDASATSPTTSSPTPSLTPSPTPTATEAPWKTLDRPRALARCGPQPAAVGEMDLDYRVLHDPAVGRIPSVAAGRGPTVAVLLHQTDGNGLCGWLEYVPALTAGSDAAVLAVDVCRFGASRCVDDVPETEVVELAVRHARDAMGADRVVVVGASMGGSVALMSAASVDGVDAAVDLSGPTDWPGMEQVRGGRAIRVRVLVAMADDEGSDQVASARRIVARAPEGSRFLPVDAGHGYELVEPFLGDIRAWIAGD